VRDRKYAREMNQEKKWLRKLEILLRGIFIVFELLTTERKRKIGNRERKKLWYWRYLMRERKKSIMVLTSLPFIFQTEVVG
jgi:hypothetical protein